MDSIELWLPWKGLNNQIKIDVEPKLKMMITKYNALKKVAFLQLDLGSYKVMAFDKIPDKISDDQDREPNIPIPKDEIMIQFIENMVANLKCLGEEDDSNILLLPGFCRLHKVGHLDLECSLCKEVVSKVLT